MPKLFGKTSLRPNTTHDDLHAIENGKLRPGKRNLGNGESARQEDEA